MSPSLPAPLGWVDSTRDRGISPAVGVALLLAIVVTLVAVFGSLALGFGDELSDPAPSGGFDTAYTATGEDNDGNGPYVTITHQGGPTADADDIVIKDEAGNQVTWSDVWTGGPVVRAGEYVHIDGVGSDDALQPICEAGDTYRIVVLNDAGNELTMYEWTAPSDPDPSAVSSEC